MTTTTHRTDIYTRVTNSILESLEKGVRPWMKPWHSEHLDGRISRPLRSNGQKYSGINILTLWIAAELQGYVSPYWLTFRQAQSLGANVKKGEHGSPVVYAATFQKIERTESGNEVEQEIPFLKQYTVFNAEQVEGLPDHFYAMTTPPTKTIERIERVDQFFANTQADVRVGGDRAYYSIDADSIRMPPLEAFRDAESHAATLAHETVHWTRAEHRLNRDFGRQKWGDEGYAMEELVAELGSAFLCADLQITPEVREDHAAYIQSWITVLQNNRKAVFTAASYASKAVDYLHSLQPQPAA